MFGQRQGDCIGNPGNLDGAVDDLTDDSPFEGGLNIVPPIVRTVLRERGSEERLRVHVIPNAEGVDENGPVGTKKVYLLQTNGSTCQLILLGILISTCTKLIGN